MVHHKHAQLCMSVKMQKFKEPPYILHVCNTLEASLSKVLPGTPKPSFYQMKKCSETKGKELGSREKWKGEKREKQHQQQKYEVIIICTWSKLKSQNNLKRL